MKCQFRTSLPISNHPLQHFGPVPSLGLSGDPDEVPHKLHAVGKYGNFIVRELLDMEHVKHVFIQQNTLDIRFRGNADRAQAEAMVRAIISQAFKGSGKKMVVTGQCT